MPGPPPPPPAAPPPMMPPPAAFTPSKGGPDNRSALLSSIRQGARLKKTVTNDKSAPIISGKVSNSTTNNSSSFGASNHSSPGAANHSSSVTPTPNGLPLGGLFAGGMPKLRPTGKLGTTNSNSQSNGDSNNHSSSIKQKQDIRSPTSKSFSSIQSELKKQMASDNRNRGPPPPAPVRQGIDNSTTGSHQSLSRVKSHEVNSASQLNLSSSLQMNTSTLHRKVKSNTNLSLFNGSSNGHNPSTKPVINHGKPNLAPKPPNVANGKTPGPPKKLITNGKLISRAQSMRTPRSPSPQSPDADMNAIKFGTVRNLSSVIGKSLGSSTGNLAPRPRPALNGRPTVPPPLVPPAQPPPPPPQQFGTPPPPSKVVKPPSEAPPPPPTHAPPPPPHRTHPARPPPAVPNSTAPPPPPRHSSMTTPRRVIASDLEDRFKFNPVSMFPKPPVYRNVTKVYSNRQAASKQQAPQPPRSQPSSSSNRSWDVQSSC